MPPREEQPGSESDMTPEMAEVLKEIRTEAAEGRRQAATVEIIGVYPVQAKEPCHAIELWVKGVVRPFSFSDFKQEDPAKPNWKWQCAWMEHVLNSRGDKVLACERKISSQPELFQGDMRVLFFMHFLNLRRPLGSPFGPITLAAETSMPARLSIVQYEEPD
jgi:hypothetical protein